MEISGEDPKNFPIDPNGQSPMGDVTMTNTEEENSEKIPKNKEISSVSSTTEILPREFSHKFSPGDLVRHISDHWFGAVVENQPHHAG